MQRGERVRFRRLGRPGERNQGVTAGQPLQLFGVGGTILDRPLVGARERILRLHDEEPRGRLPQAGMQVMIRARHGAEFGGEDLVKTGQGKRSRREPLEDFRRTNFKHAVHSALRELVDACRSMSGMKEHSHSAPEHASHA